MIDSVIHLAPELEAVNSIHPLASRVLATPPYRSDVVAVVTAGGGRGRALPWQRDGVAVSLLLLVSPRGGHALRRHAVQHLALLLPHEELHHQDLLLVDLRADVLGDVRDQPVHHVAHQHHHVLGGGGEEGGGIISTTQTTNSPLLVSWIGIRLVYIVDCVLLFTWKRITKASLAASTAQNSLEIS